MQKELIHFTQPNSEVCAGMELVIKKLIKDNPDITYVRIDVTQDHELFEYYAKKYPINYCPSFLGLVDGKVQDGHVGEATQLILESLVG
jgi:hypothetical protein